MARERYLKATRLECLCVLRHELECSTSECCRRAMQRAIDVLERQGLPSVPRSDKDRVAKTDFMAAMMGGGEHGA